MEKEAVRGPTFLYLADGIAYDIFGTVPCRYNPQLLEDAIQTLLGAQYCQYIYEFAVKKHRIDDSISSLLEICFGETKDPKEKLLQRFLCELPRKDLFTTSHAGLRFLKKGISSLRESNLARTSTILQSYLDSLTFEADPHLSKKAEDFLQGKARSRYELYGTVKALKRDDVKLYRVFKSSDSLPDHLVSIQQRPFKPCRTTEARTDSKSV